MKDERYPKSPHRTVVMRFETEMVVSMPEDFTKNEIEFFFNHSTHCIGNDIADLAKAVGFSVSDGPHEICDPGGPECGCRRSKMTYLREATQDDHDELGWKFVTEET